MGISLALPIVGQEIRFDSWWPSCGSDTDRYGCSGLRRPRWPRRLKWRLVQVVISLETLALVASANPDVSSGRCWRAID